MPAIDYFKPAGVPLAGLDEVILNVDELEAIRLKDYEGLDHASSAERMQVSVRPFIENIEFGAQESGRGIDQRQGDQD